MNAYRTAIEVEPKPERVVGLTMPDFDGELEVFSTQANEVLLVFRRGDVKSTTHMTFAEADIIASALLLARAISERRSK